MVRLLGLRPAEINHLQDWLVAADPTYLGSAVVKAEGVTKELVCSSLAFNLGLKPGATHFETLSPIYLLVFDLSVFSLHTLSERFVCVCVCVVCPVFPMSEF